MRDKHPFKDIAYNQVMRILGFLDRQDDSVTCGCFDRPYWHYKIKDFPNSRRQEAAYLLSLVYLSNFEGNRFYKNANILKWIKSAVKYWVSIQNNDGSFNEAYPYERSFVATAFSSYAVAKSVFDINDDGLKSDVFEALKKTAVWLSKHENTDTPNQIAGSIAALYSIGRLYNFSFIENAVQDKIILLKSLQDKEGYFYEYSGYDIGYLSIAVSYLAKYYKSSCDESVLEMLKNAIKFTESKVSPMGNYEWRKTSRQTQYIYPHGYEVMKSNITGSLINGLSKNEILNPTWMDDVFCAPLAIDYILTFLEEK